MSDLRPVDNEAYTFQIYGSVQGVGFRYSTVDTARRLGLVGWVRNEPDGSVTVYAEGPSEALQKLHAWLKHGPPAARVLRVAVRHEQATGTFLRFSVVY
ncbi:MAG: acylphosphatase [Termitinemataceae bacterium]